MDLIIHEDKTFESITYAGKVINGREFQNCTFKKCDFSDSEFSYSKFLDCTFDGCNLSMMKLNGSTLNNAIFRGCKVLGVNFNECQDFLFGVSFDSCLADYSSFYGKRMSKTHFIKTTLKEVNFNRTNLSNAVFDQTDLSGAVFDETNLTAANMVTAFNFSIDPELNIIKRASFSANGVLGLLSKYNIKIV